MEKTRPKPAFVWSYLAHFGANLWKDAPLVRQDLTQIKASSLESYCVGNVRFSEESWRRLSAALAKAGFDQIPAGSNFICNTNFEGLVKFCDEHCSKERIKGYLMAPWILTVDQNEEKCMEAVAQMAAAIKARRAGV